MEAEFEIPVEDGIRRNVGEMCNLSDNIWDEALLAGIAEEEEIKEILSGKTPILV